MTMPSTSATPRTGPMPSSRPSSNELASSGLASNGLASNKLTAAPGGRAASAPLIGHEEEPTIFDFSVPGRRAASFRTTGVPEWTAEELVPIEELRPEPPAVAEISERDLVGHMTRLSHRQYSVDLGAYPLGSCTMKYNPKLCDEAAALPGLSQVHPATPAAYAQGWLELLWTLSDALCRVTGMHAATLQPPAGASGELTGLLLIRAWHRQHGRSPRKILIPDSAHGTNPASVSLAGFDTVSVPSDSRGLVSTAELRRHLDDDVAGIMLTNPNTLGLFEEDIAQLAESVHDVGGLLYYDGANLNAILGVTRPGDMGFDIVHMNLHKTFAVPHGGGGPGAGPVAVTQELAELLPGPVPTRLDDGSYTWATPERSIGRVHGWHGNALALARAWAYIIANGADGLSRVLAGRGTKRQLVAGPAPGHLHRALRQARDARGRRLDQRGAGHRPRAACPRRREAAAGKRFPCPHGLFPAGRARGPHDRAHRDREPRDSGCSRRCPSGGGGRRSRCRDRRSPLHPHRPGRRGEGGSLSGAYLGRAGALSPGWPTPVTRK